MHRRGRGAIVALTATLIMCGAQTFSGASLPSVKAIESLVAKASEIKRVPANVDPPIALLSSRMPWNELAGAGRCSDPSHLCKFGPTTARGTIALFGDSHAAMWAPALVVAAEAANLRTVLLWRPQCPLTTTPSGAACTTWKAAAVRALVALHPKVIVFAERTSLTGETWNVRPSDAAWTAGLVRLAQRFDSVGVKVAMILDNPILPTQPGACLARFATSVQHCAGGVSAQSLSATTFRKAESAAMHRSGGLVIDPLPWICSTTCPVIIGHWIAYYDATHLSGAYARHLAGAMAESLDHVWN